MAMAMVTAMETVMVTVMATVMETARTGGTADAFIAQVMSI
ncbi:MAG: hypothetical protein HMLIMOIP_001471 [Candidatus Nitrosomirales archaeon]|jgi:hypothetical protein